MNRPLDQSGPNSSSRRPVRDTPAGNLNRVDTGGNGRDRIPPACAKCWNSLRSTQPAAQAQRGAILPMFVLALVALIAAAALALDMGHFYLNRTRLQNALDAAALSGGKTLDETSDTGAATTAAHATFTANANAAGNDELLSIPIDDVVVEFSENLDPFAAGSGDRFIRVSVDAFQRPTWLGGIIGIDSLTQPASAVAGPMSVCPEDLVPIVACTATGASAPDFGYVVGQSYNLLPDNHNEVGPGNFKLLSLPECGTGGACVRERLAGGFDECLNVGTTENVLTQPGQLQGPVAQGLNMRLDCPPSHNCVAGMNPTDYPPDVYTADIFDNNQTPITYAQYQAALADPNTVRNPQGASNRRIIAVPFANCDGTLTGRSDITILGLACFFLQAQVQQGGNQERVNGEYLYACPASSGPLGNSAGGPGPHTVVLYKDFTPGAVDR